jgi:hypothetical protein
MNRFNLWITSNNLWITIAFLWITLSFLWITSLKRWITLWITLFWYTYHAGQNDGADAGGIPDRLARRHIDNSTEIQALKELTTMKGIAMNCNAHYPLLLNGQMLSCTLEAGHDGMHTDTEFESPATYSWED